MNLIESMIFPVPKVSYEIRSPGISTITDLKDSHGTEVPVINLYSPKFKYTVLYFHGNAEDLGHVLPLGQLVFKQGFNFFSPEYPGYGCYPGTPSELDFYSVAELTLQYLLNSKRRVIVIGRSIGTGPASELGSKFPDKIETLVLVSPFKSISDMAMEKFPVVGSLVPQRFDNLGKIKDVTCPLLLLHGKFDTMVPSDHSVKLLKKCKSKKKKLFIIDGRDHNNLLDSNVISKSLDFLRGWLH